MSDDFEFTEETIDSSTDELFYEEDVSAIRSTLGNDVEMEGELHLRNGLEIKGYYDGSIVSNSLVHVKPSGELNGDIDAFHVIIEGKSHSRMIAKKRLEVLKGGTFIGTLELQPEIIVLSEHAVFGSGEKVANEYASEFVRDRSQKSANA